MSTNRGWCSGKTSLTQFNCVDFPEVATNAHPGTLRRFAEPLVTVGPFIAIRRELEQLHVGRIVARERCPEDKALDRLQTGSTCRL